MAWHVTCTQLSSCRPTCVTKFSIRVDEAGEFSIAARLHNHAEPNHYILADLFLSISATFSYFPRLISYHAVPHYFILNLLCPR